MFILTLHVNNKNTYFRGTINGLIRKVAGASCSRTVTLELEDPATFYQMKSHIDSTRRIQHVSVRRRNYFL